MQKSQCLHFIARRIYRRDGHRADHLYGWPLCVNKLHQLFNIADDFEHNMQTNYRISILPSMICIGGVFFLHFGLWAGMMLYYGAMVSGWANTILPLVKYQELIETRETFSNDDHALQA